MNNRQRLLDAALGKIESDLAITNTRLVNVFTGEIYPATVFVKDGFIVHVEYEDLNKGIENVKEVVDAENRYIVPGLIDSHIHIESSMMTPRNFASAVIPHGVSTVITDPHEIANVYGVEAVRFMHDAGLDVPMNQFIDIPSCVPAVPNMEQAGAVITAKDVDELASLQNVIGLAEVMDFVGVINGDERMNSMIEAARRNDLYIQGHMPAGTPRMLSAYLIGGPITCHETTRPGEALAKLRAGMYVDARESSIAKNAEVVWNDVKNIPWRDRLTICTDDREADDILNDGQIDSVVRRMITLGMNPVEAIRNCTIHNAQAANIENLGAIAPGYEADFLLLDSLEDFDIKSVWFRGEKVAEDYKLINPIPEKHFEIETRNSVIVPNLSECDFRMKAPAGSKDFVTVNVMNYPNLVGSYTEVLPMKLPIKDGYVDISGEPDLFHAMIINRHGKNNYSLGLVRGFGAKCGANGSTVSHDCHNLCIVYKDIKSGYAVFNALKECHGGMAAAVDGKIVGLLPLPCAGLMNNGKPEEVAELCTNMKKALHEHIGMTQENPLLRIVTLALPVIPNVKFSDLGMVDVLNQKFIPIFEN